MPSRACPAARSEIGRICGSGIAACRKWTSLGLVRADRLSAVSLSQHDVLGSTEIWPVAMQLGLNYPNRAQMLDARRSERKNSPVARLKGPALPAFIFANDQDYAYARFLLDPRSRDAVIDQLGGIDGSFPAHAPVGFLVGLCAQRPARSAGLSRSGPKAPARRD